MTLATLYNNAAREGDEGENARRLLLQADWFARMAEFDPRSGEALMQPLTPFLRKVFADSRPDEGWKIRDRLSRLVEHCRFALEHVIKQLNENPMREHSEMPIRDVRELDAACFMKLSNRPGRTIREKLASRPYLQAVRRFQSIDLPENRLVKAFAVRLVELLRSRAECLGAWLKESPDDLIEKLERWLRSDEANAISRWDNPPPNNTLLSHRDYRRIYDSWRWMQSLDDDIAIDFEHIEERQTCMDFWQYVAELRFKSNVIIAEVPVRFSYDSFLIESRLDGCVWLHDDKGHHELPIGARLGYEPPDRLVDDTVPVVDSPVCIDFTTGTAAFTTGEEIELLTRPLSYQQWEDREGREDISLFAAGAAYKGAGVTTVDSSDFFTSPNAIRGQAYEAAVSIADDLRRVFRHDSMTWLVPDIVKDFDLTPLRQAINAVYNDAEPVPRSIAAVFQLVKASQIKRDGFSVAVIDRNGSDVFVTKLVARFDGKLAKVLPETGGYAWERQPAVHIYFGNMENVRCNYDFVTEERQWYFAEWRVPKLKCSNKELVKHIGAFDVSVFIETPPILGGYRLLDLEARSKGVPLWYDQLPELSTRIPINGIWDKFYFVEKKNAKVTPQRGVPVDILVEQSFVLPPGKNQYEFPLYMGSGNTRSQFVAVLRSVAFPLNVPLRCSLKMTYTYGAIQPYNLAFVPQDSTVKPMTVIWDTKEANVSDLVPEFPEKDNWGTLVTMRFPHSADGLLTHVLEVFDEINAYISGAKSGDLIAARMQKLSMKISGLRQKRQKLTNEIADICKYIEMLDDSWKSGVVNSYVLRDKNDAPYCFVSCEHVNVFSHSSNWADDVSPESLTRGDQVWMSCQPDSRTNKFSGMWMSKTPARPLQLDRMIAARRKSLARIEGQVKSFEEQISSYELQLSSFCNADIQNQIQANVERLVKSCRIPIRRIWNNGRSFWDIAAPECFRQHMEVVMQRFEVCFHDSSVPLQIKDLLADLLHPLHKDMPHSLVEVDMRNLSGGRNYDILSKHVGYVVGDASLDWQRQLFGWMLIQAENGYFSILKHISIALWRCKGLVYRLQAKDCRMLCSTIEKSIKEISKKIKTGISRPASEERDRRLTIDTASAKYDFEVLLALIRLRKSPDDEVARIFAPDTPMSTMLLDLVDSFAKLIVTNQLPFSSRVSPKISKPEQLVAMPDLLYVLRLLLSGDDGANNIIVEVGEEDD